MVRLSLLFQVTFVLDDLVLVTHVLTSLVEERFFFIQWVLNKLFASSDS